MRHLVSLRIDQRAFKNSIVPINPHKNKENDNDCALSLEKLGILAEGEFDEALPQMREAVRREDALLYDEPPE